MKTKVSVVKEFTIGKSEDTLFSSFIEQLGRAVYTGIYEPEHPESDELGFRKDVIKLVKDLGVNLVRYPGGNFVSGYDWKDGIGPKDKRPVRLDRAWKTIETNQVGIDDFYDWTLKSGTQILGAVNMGTGTVQDAGDLVEYCNYPGGTYWSDLRRKNGHEKPYAIKTWCVGNEMDGPWQICHLDAHEYGKKALETIKMMKWTDDTIKCVVCGSAASTMPTYPEWDRIVLEHTYDMADYISIHRYFENFGNDDDFLASFYDMEQFIKTSIATCDYVKAVKRSNRTMMLSFDEWNIWYQKNQTPHDWVKAPRLLEDNYSLLDALAFGGMVITLLNHSDRIKIACLAQLVNVIAPISTEPGGGSFVQTIYYPFKDMCQFGRGTVLQPVVKTQNKITDAYGEVPAVIFSVIYNEEKNTVTVFALNTSKDEDSETEIDLASFENTKLSFWSVLCGTDLNAKNSLSKPDNVKPQILDDAVLSKVEQNKGVYKIQLKKASWNVLSFTIQ
ncbi:MAG: alpha-N-arabinofuranosidase [Treponema sp.]|uniref:arabinosylfuranosidase ArfA n=1 Tax=Treponema sp. TaxID=166 RepID=UPI00298DF07E|nr:alpha-N-arabinofuranosidase [Treponema sp.]MBR5933397.1 alpha-N-arabinofuranosidase [Treponema sp.]